MDQDEPGPDAYRAAAGIVTFVGIYQGAVPLVVRPIFGADQRFAPALWLRSPWWWMACLVIVAATAALVAVLEQARARRAPAGAGGTPDRPDTSGADGGSGDSEGAGGAGSAGRSGSATTGYDALSGLVFLVGIYNGVAPFVARLLLDGNVLLALPLRLPAPWWWITSVAVIVVTVVLLDVIDRAKQRRHN